MPKVSQEYLDARKREIIDAAMACFARQGFHGTSLSDIRDRAGVSNGALYHYFKSKEEIIAALRERSVMEDEAAYFGAEDVPSAKDFLVALVEQGMMLNHGSPENTDARVALMLWAEALTSRRISESQASLMTAWWAVAATLLERAVELNELRDDVDREALSLVITATSLGATVLEAWNPGQVSAERLAATVGQLFLGQIWREEAGA